MSMRAQGYAWVWLWGAIVVVSIIALGATVVNAGKGCSEAASLDRLRIEMETLQAMLAKRQLGDTP